MKSKLKVALVRQLSSVQQGFATVVALGLGLSLTLIGVMMMTRSQSDVSTVSSQRAVAKSLAAAETGIVRLQTLIDRNRAIAIHPMCKDNVSFITTGTCPDTGSTNPSWFNYSAIPAASSPISATVPLVVTRNWQNIDAANPSKGQYRAIEYSYDDINRVGTLTIEGRVEQDIGRGPSTTRLEVTIPIDSTAGAAGIPGLWAQSFRLDNIAVNIAANVLDSSEVMGGTSFAPTYNSFLRNLPNAPIPNARPFPLSTTPSIVTKKNTPFPPLPGITYAGQVASIPAANMNNKSCVQTTTEEKSYPEDGDVFTDAAGTLGTYSTTDAPTAPSMSGNYAYRFADGCGGSISLNQTGNMTFGTTLNQTFSIFIDGNLTTANTGTIRAFPGTPGATDSAVLIIYSNGDIKLNNAAGLTPPEKMQIYNYGVRQITTANVGDIRAFLFAPESNVRSDNAGSFIGAVWAKTFSSSNAGSVYQANLDASKLKVSISAESSNRLGNISSWKRKQIN